MVIDHVPGYDLSRRVPWDFLFLFKDSISNNLRTIKQIS